MEERRWLTRILTNHPYDTTIILVVFPGHSVKFGLCTKALLRVTGTLEQGWNERAMPSLRTDCLVPSLLSSDQVISEDFQEPATFRIASEFLDVSTTDFKTKRKTGDTDSWDEERVHLQRRQLLSCARKTQGKLWWCLEHHGLQDHQAQLLT